jgi:tripartite-type tricarboxylate transporter receptor subunit TctC
MQKIPEMEGWDVNMQVEYKQGAGGRIQWRALANAEPDGYTIGFAPTAMFLSAIAEDLVYKHDNLSYIFNMMSDPGAIGVAYDSEIETLDDLVEKARNNPGEVTIGVTSVIGQEGLTMKQIQKEAGVEFNLVAFDGGSEVMTQIMGGHIDGFCLNISDTTSYVDNNQVKVIATGDQKRSQFLPDVPTYIESGYDVTQVNMRSVAAPKDLPEPIRKYLENCFIEASKDPKIQEKAKELQMPLDVMRGEETRKTQYAMAEAYQELWEENPWQ